jgi:hypothetical protein
MDYLETLKRKFKIDKVDYEAIQYLLEKKYTVWSNKNIYTSYDNDEVMSFEELLNIIKQLRHYSIMFNGISFIFNDKYIINVKRNNISRKELFYILYVLYAQTNVKISKKDLKLFFKAIR